MLRQITAPHRLSCARPSAADPQRLLAPSRWTRVLARWRGMTLDREIAAGADLAGSPVLAARAAHLSTGRTRARVAADLERVVGLTDASPPALRSVPRREAIRDNRDQLMELARILREDRAAYASGIALLSLVVTDGAGPAYTDRCGERLARQLRRARERLAQ